MAKKEGEPENILSTQSSPGIYRIRKGNATPIFPKDRQPMEEVGNLEVILFSVFFLVNCYFFNLSLFCASSRSKFHYGENMSNILKKVIYLQSHNLTVET